jgi:hypothetical protein
MGRWRGWNRQAVAPVEIRHVAPTVAAEPMTPKQGDLLRKLCEKHGEKFNPSWSKRSATRRIQQLQARKAR